MKNSSLLPPDLLPVIEQFQWRCGCSQEGLRVSITRKSTIQGRCYRCGHTIFWNDLELFRSGQPVCPHQVTWKSMKKPGWTSWCAACRVRQFKPEIKF